MKAADIEWSMLRGALIGLTIAVAVTGAMLMASYNFSKAAKRTLSQAQSQRRTAEERYRKLDEHEVMIATYYPAFQDLEKEGVVGEERRLKWVEALKEADENLKLPNLAYSIDTQQRHQPQFPLSNGAYKLFASQMNLELGLLHGQDLLNLLRRLDDNAGGLYSVDSCNLTRRRQEPGSPKDVHLKTRCRLYWYTIKKPEGRSGAS